MERVRCYGPWRWVSELLLYGCMFYLTNTHPINNKPSQFILIPSPPLSIHPHSLIPPSFLSPRRWGYMTTSQVMDESLSFVTAVL